MSTVNKADFGERYFADYGGDNVSYEENMWRYTFDLEYVAATVERLNRRSFRSVIDLGAADGKVLDAWRQRFSSIETAHGIEISDYALAKGVPGGVQVFRGDVLCALNRYDAGRPMWASNLLSSYDAILCCMGMYLTEAQLTSQLLPCIREHMHENSVLYFLVTAGVSTHHVATYEGGGMSRSEDDPAPILSRPKSWWIATIERAGFSFVEDDGCGSVVFTRSMSNYPRSVIHTPFGVRAIYPGTREGVDSAKGSCCPVFLQVESGSLREFHLSCPDNFTLFIEQGGPVEESEYAEWLEGMPKVLAMLRSGELGYCSNAKFRPTRVKPLGCPGLFSFEKDGLWHNGTDYFFQLSASLDDMFALEDREDDDGRGF